MGDMVPRNRYEFNYQYMLQRIVEVDDIADFFVGGLAGTWHKP
jgi:hypothetical protein